MAYVLLWIIQQIAILFFSDIPKPSFNDLAEIIVVLGGLFLMMFPAAAPFIIITYICEKMNNRGIGIKELTVKMSSMTALNFLFSAYVFLMPAIHSKHNDSGLGWAFIAFIIYFINFPLIFAGKKLGDYIYDEYYKPDKWNSYSAER